MFKKRKKRHHKKKHPTANRVETLGWSEHLNSFKENTQLSTIRKLFLNFHRFILNAERHPYVTPGVVSSSY